MKAYKLKEDQHNYMVNYKAGRIFVNNDGIAICLATPTEETVWCGNYFFRRLLESNSFTEVELQSEKWIQPHICKEVRKKLELGTE